MTGETVLVTGGSGFVGAHCIVQLLQAGYRVRTTVRSLGRADDVRGMIARAGADAAGGPDGGALEFFAADLTADAGWADAAAGADFVLHVASPFPVTQPKDADELIVPARDGALRVLRAARDAGVGRVVLTSSFAAVGYGRSHPGREYTESDWTDPDDRTVTPYVQSKTIAERAAWEFVDREGDALELAVVNPVAVFGPVLGPHLSGSVELLRGLLRGAVPAVPRGSTSVVDVRDVADLHLRAMRHPDAAGRRYLASSGSPLSFPELAALLRANLGPAAARVPRRVIPDWVVRAGSLVNPQLRAVLPQLGRPRPVSHAQASTQLGWTPRGTTEAVLATAESLMRLSLVDVG